MLQTLVWEKIKSLTLCFPQLNFRSTHWEVLLSWGCSVTVWFQDLHGGIVTWAARCLWSPNPPQYLSWTVIKSKYHFQSLTYWILVAFKADKCFLLLNLATSLASMIPSSPGFPSSSLVTHFSCSTLST